MSSPGASTCSLLPEIPDALPDFRGARTADSRARWSGIDLERTHTHDFPANQSAIAACRKVFEFKSPEDRRIAAENAKMEAERLAHVRHHRVTCPACGFDATVQGEAFGPQHITHEDDNIVVRQCVSPRTFACSACGLKLQGYAELDAAKLGGQYTRRTDFSPEDFYSLIDPETADLTPYIEAYMADMANEYDNE